MDSTWNAQYAGLEILCKARIINSYIIIIIIIIINLNVIIVLSKATCLSASLVVLLIDLNWDVSTGKFSTVTYLLT